MTLSIGNCNKFIFTFGFDNQMWDWMYHKFGRNWEIILYLSNNSKPNSDQPNISEFDQTLWVVTSILNAPSKNVLFHWSPLSLLSLSPLSLLSLSSLSSLSRRNKTSSLTNKLVYFTGVKCREIIDWRHYSKLTRFFLEATRVWGFSVPPINADNSKKRERKFFFFQAENFFQIDIFGCNFSSLTPFLEDTDFLNGSTIISLQKVSIVQVRHSSFLFYM